MATSTWFVRSEGRIRGPFDAMHLHKMLQRGLLLWQHELSEDRRHWVKAQDHPMFEGLAPTRADELELTIEPIAAPRKGPPPLPPEASRPRQVPPPPNHWVEKGREAAERLKKRNEEVILDAEVVEEPPPVYSLDLTETKSDLAVPDMEDTGWFDGFDLEAWKDS